MPFPVISEPENCVLPFEDTLKWNQFKFSGDSTVKQIKHNKSNNQNVNLSTLRQKLGAADPNREYTGAELAAYGITDSCKAAAVRNGFLVKLGAGHNTRYILQFLKEE